jgi:hypothetical protein
MRKTRAGICVLEDYGIKLKNSAGMGILPEVLVLPLNPGGG